jgi:FtsZ-interacting cell division protein ZipA
MSLLLDALNKADQERKRNETPGISSNHEQHGGEDEPRGYRLGLILGGVVGLALLLILIYWLGQRSTVSAPAKTNTVSSSAATDTTTQESAAVETKPAETNEPQQAASTDQPTPEAEENVADLYQQNSQVPPENASITISAPPPAPEQPVPDPEPPANPPAPTTDSENTPPSTSIAQFANVPELHDLPNNILEKVPTLNYSEHNYNVNGGSVKINGVVLRADEQIANGIVIDAILEDGIILHIDNYPFKMRAMNSWVNM